MGSETLGRVATVLGVLGPTGGGIPGGTHEEEWEQRLDASHSHGAWSRIGASARHTTMFGSEKGSSGERELGDGGENMAMEGGVGTRL